MKYIDTVANCTMFLLYNKLGFNLHILIVKNNQTTQEQNLYYI